jgi:putative ABC transport system permease protein
VRWLRARISRLIFVVMRRRFDEDTRLEIDAHLESLTERYRRQGMPADEAYLAARRRFGSTINLRQDIHEMNSIGWIEHALQAVRDARQSLRRDRAYAATVILTLAVTIGATTAVFSIVDATLIRPLPFADAGRLVAIREIWREILDRAPSLEVNERHFEHWRAHATSFDALAQFWLRPMNLTGPGDAVPVTVVHASGSLFDVLHVSAAIGRTLTPGDEAENAPDVAMITHTLWRNRFGANPQAVGQSIVLDGTPYTITGVLPAGFGLPRRDQFTTSFDLIVPLRVSVGWIGDHNNDAIGRLRTGVTIEEARAELDVLQAQAAAIASREGRRPVTLASVVIPLAEHVVRGSRRGLLLLLAASAGVLLIACFNLANLSLARSVARQREAAIRSALGASRPRLVSRALFEQLLLSLTAGAFGLWVAWAGLSLFVRTASVDLPRLDHASLDLRAMAFAAAVAAITALVVALLPAWRIAGGGILPALRASAPTVTGDRAAHRSHAALLALQVGLSVPLLVVTMLFAASFVRVLNADRGFVPERVLAVDVAFPAVRYAGEAVRNGAYDRLLAAVQALPGVETATTTSMLPLRGQSQVNFIALDGQSLSGADLADLPSANFRLVAPDFFRTLGIEIRRGRSFTAAERDPNRPAPALVSEATTARLWPGENPLGKRFSRGIPTEQGFEVVGVVSDARTTTLDGTPPLMVYVPYWWRSRTSTSLLIQTAVDSASMLPSVRRAIREIDPEIAVGDARPLTDLVDAAMAGRRQQTQLFTAFGLVALFIAAVGIFAVTSFTVSRRRREMNVRVALGAPRAQVVGQMLRQGMTPVLIGIAAGIAGALAIGNLVASLLFDVAPRDPAIITGVVAMVFAVGLATCGLAVRRGLAIDPSRALREE